MNTSTHGRRPPGAPRHRHPRAASRGRRPGARMRGGFTLLELLVVIALIGLIAAFTWPDFFQSAKAAQLGATAQRMKTLVAMCRAQAMNEARAYRLTLTADGAVHLTRQADAIYAPDQFVFVRDEWASGEHVQPEVWIESALLLPEGPPPIVIDNEEILFDEQENPDAYEPVLLEEFVDPIVVEFAPDGTSDSLRWILRDTRGRGLQLTLDGRLGRVVTAPVELLPKDEAVKPEREPVEFEEDEVDLDTLTKDHFR